MAEETTKKKLSPETEAIIDRLKREGQLTRNSEGNSIKSIKINLDKFADAFTAIQKSTEETAKIMTENFVEGNTEILKKVDETLEGLTDEQKAAEIERRKEAQRAAIAKKESDRESLFGKDAFVKNFKGAFDGLKKGFLEVKKNPWGSLLKIGKWAIILPVIAGAIKGLLDLIFGDTEMARFYKDLNDSEFIKFVKNNPWKSIGAGLVAISLVNWAKMYTAMMAAAATMRLAGGGGGGTGPIVGTPDMGPKEPAKNKIKRLLQKAKTPKGGISGLIGLVTIGGVLYALGDDDEPVDVTAEIERINKETSAKDDVEVKKLVDTYENERAGFGTILSEAVMGGAGGAAVGALGFGVGAIPGAISGAVLGALYGLGKVANDFRNDIYNDIDNIPNELEAALKEEKQNSFTRDTRGRRTAKSAEELAAMADKVNEDIQRIIGDKIKRASDIDTEIESLRAGLDGEVTSERRGSSRVFTDYVTIDGQLVRKSEVESNLKALEEERLLREQQIATSKRILALRTGEVEELEKNNSAIQENTEAVKKSTEKTDMKSPEIEPGQTEERERRQNVAAGGFALNITNNYYNKGGDTVVQNQSDNRVASTKNTAINAGGGGGGRFGLTMPTGQMA